MFIYSLFIIHLRLRDIQLDKHYTVYYIIFNVGKVFKWITL